MTHIKMERCSCCGDDYPQGSMEKVNGKPICIVCLTAGRKPKENLFKIFGEFFEPQKQLSYGK